MNLVFGFILLFIFIILSGVFSGIEAAYLSLSNLKVRKLAKDLTNKRAQDVKELKDDSHKLIITLLIGNNLVNISASAIATALAIDISISHGIGESYAIGMATGIMTFIILIVGEIIPKSKAILHAESICLKTAKFLRLLKKILFPAILILDFITRKFLGKRNPTNKPLITEEELKSFVEIGEESGSIEKDEREMIHNIFKLNDLEVSEIMTPKIKMVCVDGNKTLKENLDFFVSSRHTRIPVYLKNPEIIIGILNIRDLLINLKDQNLNIKIKDLVKEPIFIPESKKVDILLSEMQKQIQQIAIIVDEYGVVAGLVTIEDILEEIVGEIYDETDLIESKVIKLNKNCARVKGETSIEDLNKKFKTSIRATESYDTISGFILKELGKIPSQGEEINLSKFNIVVEKVQNNRIVQVRITKK